jgi:hypothetical protein
MRDQTPPELPRYPDSVPVPEVQVSAQPAEIVPATAATPLATVEDSVSPATAPPAAEVKQPASDSPLAQTKAGGLSVSADMGDLNRKTNEALADGRLIGPPNNNAYFWL